MVPEKDEENHSDVGASEVAGQLRLRIDAVNRRWHVILEREGSKSVFISQLGWMTKQEARREIAVIAADMQISQYDQRFPDEVEENRYPA
jgi:hypothetical protein